MGSNTLMSLGVRALNANYVALQTVGHNISNVNTVGYSRQEVQFETAEGQSTGQGFIGRGVNVATVLRAHTEMLTREAATTQAQAASDSARSTRLQQLEQAFPTGQNGLGYAANKVFGSFVDVANAPQDSSARQAVLANLGDLVTRFRSSSDQIEGLQSNVATDLREGVVSANALAQRVADLNRQIKTVGSLGQQPNDLLDQRDQAINDLSKLIQTTTVTADDGSVSVYVAGGQKLVDSAEVNTLVAGQDSVDPRQVAISLQTSKSVRSLSDSTIGAGSLAGMLKFQAVDLVDARNQIGQLASAIAGSLNAQQALGLDARTVPGVGGPLLDVGAGRVLPSTNNANVNGVPVASLLSGSGQRIPSVSFTVTNPQALQASDYQLLADASLPAGSYQLTRVSDCVKTTVSDGSVVDGFRINVASPAPSAGDFFVLQPVGSAAAGLQRVLDDPRGIAAASPVVGVAGSANSGTATIASLQATASGLNSKLTTTITFTGVNGAYQWTSVDSTVATSPTSGTGTWTAGQPIVLNNWSMDLHGVPDKGDTFSVAPTKFAARNNGNANAFVALAGAPLVGRNLLPDGSVSGGTSVTDAYANLLANVGVRVQSAKVSADLSGTLAAQAKTAQTGDSGVNLDEEAAKLIQYQQSYQAAAKMLQVAQTIFDQLLQTAGH
jgi:flagellar hook-associated protein 1 FlgK